MQRYPKPLEDQFDGKGTRPQELSFTKQWWRVKAANKAAISRVKGKWATSTSQCMLVKLNVKWVTRCLPCVIVTLL